MRAKRLFLTGISALLALLAGSPAAAPVSATDFRSVDGRAQLLKEEAFKLNRDLLLFSEDLLYPAAERVAVFLSLGASETFQLDALELMIDGDLAASHRYTERESEALLRGGAQQLYVGVLPEGEHELVVVASGKGPKGRSYRERGSMIFYKQADRKIIELALVQLTGKPHPKFHLPMSVRDRQSRKVSDPHFGEVLFHFYKNEYFSAAIHLMAAQSAGELHYDGQQAALLLAELYLAYGLHRRASQMFARALNQSVPPDVNARARFYLAKSWYQRGYLRAALDALLDLRDPLPANLAEQRRILLALTLMKQNRYGEAVAILSQLRSRSEWGIYARYNMGVGLIQIGRTREGVAVLEKIARMRTGRSEMTTLKDKANLALGYAFLGVPDPGRARSYFREVRLNGPFSNKALLGTGWALSSKGKHKQSLVPWMELYKRGDIDVAVQESLLAVPYAFTELGAYKQALQHYQDAIVVYNAEIEQLTQAVESLRAGESLAVVVSARTIDNPRSASSIGETLPATPENRYLVQLFASHDFHEALKNYRQLLSLSDGLECWSRVLGNDENSELGALLERLRQRLAQAAAAKNIDTCEDLDGARHWQFADNYEPSLWRTDITSVPVRLTAPEKSPDMSASRPKGSVDEQKTPDPRIEILRRRISQLKGEIDKSSHAHERFLQELAAVELERQRQRLRAYVTQARFGIAQVYDRSDREHGRAQ